MGYLWLQVTLDALLGIEPYEVLQALGARRRLPVPAISPRGVRVLIIWARTQAGRPLVVALRRDSAEPYNWWIVGARGMTAAERAAFEQWEVSHD